MRREHLGTRLIVLIIGLWIMALGVALSIQADLGTSPISGVPYTLSLITPLSVGVLTILMHIVFITLQILILRKNYSPIQLLQLPIALVFGVMTDGAVYVLRNVNPSGYMESLLFCFLGIIMVAIGVSAEVASDAVPLAGEGLAIAIFRRTGMKFGTAKVAVDCSLVTIALILSLFFLHSLGAIREGTIFAAILVGTIARQINRAVIPLREKFL